MFFFSRPFRSFPPHQAYFILPWNRVKTLSLGLTAAGLLWFIFFTSPGDWGSVFREEGRGKK